MDDILPDNGTGSYASHVRKAGYGSRHADVTGHVPPRHMQHPPLLFGEFDRSTPLSVVSSELSTGRFRPIPAEFPSTYELSNQSNGMASRINVEFATESQWREAAASQMITSTTQSQSLDAADEWADVPSITASLRPTTGHLTSNTNDKSLDTAGGRPPLLSSKFVASLPVSQRAIPTGGSSRDYTASQADTKAKPQPQPTQSVSTNLQPTNHHSDDINHNNNIEAFSKYEDSPALFPEAIARHMSQSGISSYKHDQLQQQLEEKELEILEQRSEHLRVVGLLKDKLRDKELRLENAETQLRASQQRAAAGTQRDVDKLAQALGSADATEKLQKTLDTMTLKYDASEEKYRQLVKASKMGESASTIAALQAELVGCRSQLRETTTQLEMKSKQLATRDADVADFNAKLTEQRATVRAMHDQLTTFIQAEGTDAARAQVRCLPRHECYCCLERK
jgi:hypothetical protein